MSKIKKLLFRTIIKKVILIIKAKKEEFCNLKVVILPKIYRKHIVEITKSNIKYNNKFMF